jgi:sugar phosphate isomerase/epimerase
MKNSFLLIPLFVCALFFTRCSEQAAPTNTPETSSANDTTGDWILGVQLWTFHQFPFVTAIEKTDSSDIDYIEAFLGQQLGGSFQGNFDVNTSSETRAAIRQLLQSKGITMIAFGVVVPNSIDEWRKTFQLGKDMGVRYITAEPLKQHLDSVNILSGQFGIPIAIHDHPRPSAYAHPDSVIAAMNGRPNIYACADVGHWARSGYDVVECLKKLEGRIIGGHLKDVKVFNQTDAADTRLGTGVIKFPDVFAELKRQKFTGMLSIENEANWQNNVPDVIYNKKYYEEQTSKLK